VYGGSLSLFDSYLGYLFCLRCTAAAAVVSLLVSDLDDGLIFHYGLCCWLLTMASHSDDCGWATLACYNVCAIKEIA
jgi:hypothetical protein